ncbi:hypothetical protein [Lonsdalea iberica]|uniref:Uncharacterized protein n=1 Tax=Lonsdalea iberica TaxID=1082703 RepID=A0A1X3RPX7_9GAMM|nr:hypothetical protein [Lonsdalea iberica]OSN03829.1 hypothetical protein AU511_14140 [Lonsdalea iberica]
MPELSVIIKWMNQYPKTGWILLLIYIVLGVVRHRVINAESGSVFRGLLNLRKRRLEKMLEQPYLNKNAISLVRRELRQRSLYQLTGLYNYRLQDLAIIFCDRYGLRAGYLKPWRNWLNEKEGQIVFKRKWHCFRWRIFLAVLIVNVILLVAFIMYIFSHASAEMIAPLIMFYVLLWLFPWLMVVSVPTPAWTREMEAYLKKFNAEQRMADSNNHCHIELK